jgi:serine/threonine-protein kinase
MIGILEGLEHAHRNGVIHRDIKPDNIFLHRTSTDVTVPKILDFGIAQLVRQETATPEGVDPTMMPTAPMKTDPHSVVGTAGYMAPEQLRGEPVDRSWDLWALAVIAFESIVGTRPVACAATALVGKGTARAATWDSLTLQRLSPSLAGFFSRALAIDPMCRPATASAFLRELREASLTNG